MSSGHNYEPHTHLDSQTNLAFAFLFNLIFAIFEFIAGVYLGSQAVLSNALHDAGDSMSIALALVLQRKAESHPSENFSYGLKRLSLLSALISGVVICLGAIYIIYESYFKMANPGEPKAQGMLAISVIGIAINAAAAWRLGKGETHNEKILSWHLIEDMLGWVAVLLGGLFILWLDWRWLDAALAIAISVFVAFNVIKNLLKTLSLFLQGNPDPEALRDFKTAILLWPEIKDLHDLHFWSLDGAHHVLSMHVVTSWPLEKSGELKTKIRAESHRLGECHLTIEVEAMTEHCTENCDEPHEHA